MGVNFKALAQIPGMYRAGQEAGYRREQRETARKDRAYQDRLEEASGKIVNMPGITGDQVLALASEYEVNPMDLHKVLSDFKKFEHQQNQMNEFSSQAKYNQGVRAANEAQRGRKDAFMTDVAGSGLPGGKFSPEINPAGAMYADNPDPTQVKGKMVREGVAAGVRLPEIGALAETLGLPSTPGVGPTEKPIPFKSRTMYKGKQEVVVNTEAEQQAAFNQGFKSIKDTTAEWKPLADTYFKSNSWVMDKKNKPNPKRVTSVRKAANWIGREAEGTLDADQATNKAVAFLTGAEEIPKPIKSTRDIMKAATVVRQMLAEDQLPEMIAMALKKKGANKAQIQQIMSVARGETMPDRGGQRGLIPTLE